MKQEIQQILMDFLLKARDEDVMKQILADNAPYLLDEDGDFDVELVVSGIDKVSDILLPGLSKYEPRDVIDAVMGLENIDEQTKFQLVIMFCPTNIMLEFMRYYYQNNKESFLDNIQIVRDGQIELLAELGFSYREMLPFVETPKCCVDLYKHDKSLFDDIISSSFNSYSMESFVPIILEQYLFGGDYVLSTVLEKIGNYGDHRSKFLNLFIEELISINRFDVDKLISSLELSGLEIGKFVSCITDENLMRRMIEVGGAKALIFCKDFSPEIVDLASDFTFEDYKMFDGDYKKSPALLKLVSEKYPDSNALYYCKNEALTPETAVYLSKFSDDSISNLNDFNSNISRNYLLYKEMKSRGLYLNFHNVKDLYSNIDAFNFLIECFSDGSLETRFLDCGNLDLAYYIFKKDYEKISNLYFRDTISREVAEAIVALGFDANNYVKYFVHQEELSNIYLEHGNVEVLFMRGVPDKYLEVHSELITYEMYLKLKETNPSFVIGLGLVKKFVQQGHFDVLNEIDILKISQVYDLHDIGLNNMTYEEFLAADHIVRKVPALMLKFMEHDSTLFDEYAKLFPESEVVISRKINSGNVSYEEFLELIKNYDSFLSRLEIDEEVVLKYLQEGHLEFIFKLSSNVLTTKVLDFIIDNFDIDNFSKNESGHIDYQLLERMIERKDYRFLPVVSYLQARTINKIVKSGFTLDDFSKSGYQSLDYLEYYISKENEDKIMQIIGDFVKRGVGYVSLNSDFVIKCINEGFDVEHINSLLSHISVNVVELLKGIPKEKYDILNQLNINSLFVNKTVADLLLSVLNHEKIKSSLAYCTEDIRKYIIRKMVNLGYYDFIDCYASGIEVETVKKALLGGYFPVSEALSNGIYRSKITGLKFTSEELEYLRTRLDTCPYLVIFFKDIINDAKTLNEYLINEPNLLLFFGGEIVNNLPLLYALYQKDKKILVSLIYKSDVTDKTIIDLYLNYDLDINCIRHRLNGAIVGELIHKYPYLIDIYELAYTSIIVKAFENGYKLNENSNSSAIVVAFLNGFNQPGDEKYLDKVKSSGINELLGNIKYDLFIAHKDLFLDKYFEGCYSSNNYFYSEDSQVNRYVNLIFYISSISVNSISDEEKNIVLEALNKYGHSETYISMSCNALTALFGSEVLIKGFLEDKIHKSILKYIDLNDEQKVLVVDKLTNDFNSREYTLDEKIELLSLLKCFNINGGLVSSLYDDLYELYKSSDNREKFRNLFDSEYLYDKLMNDDTFEFSLLDELYFSDADKIQKVANRILELLQNNTYSAKQYYCVCSWLFYNGIRDVSNKLAMTVFELDPERFSTYIINPTTEFLSELPKYLREHPILLERFDVVLDDKNLVIDLINANFANAYDKANDILKNDIDVCMALISVCPEKITEISLENPNYRELLKVAISKNGILLETEFSRKPELINDIELIRLAIVTHPNIIVVVDPNIVDDSLLNLITNYSIIDFDKVEVSLFEKMLIVIERNGLNENVVSKILAYVSKHSEEEKLLNNDIFIKCVRDNISNPELFKQIVVISRNKVVLDNLDAEVVKVLEDALYILDSTGKVNILEKNPIFSYDLVKYVYPVVGLNETINLMNYTTGANDHLIRLIKSGGTEFVKNYISMLKEYNMFELNDKFIHYAFRKFDSIEPLIKEVLESGRVLSDAEIGDLKKVILNNRFKISSLDELSRYDTIMVEKINQAFELNDLQSIKDYLAIFFGYGSIKVMEKQFNDFQFGNMAILRFVLNDIKEHYGDEVYNRVKITSEEIGLILLMQRIIESKDVNFLRELIDEYIINNDSDKDFYDDVQNLTAKFRLLFNYQYNSKLTKLDGMTAEASEYKDTGVKIVEFNGEPFNFLSHRLFTYDSTHHGFADMLANDPSLWTALDGASTLSCSSISDKGFHFLHSSSSSGVVYLFNELPEEFMLFMYGHDLYVEHGGHKMEPMARDNSFTDIDGLNQNTSQNGSSYNEVAGFRRGMIPCAFVCLGDVPNPETIRAAQYFSKKLGKDIPIVKFNKVLYEKKNKETYDNAVSQLHNTVSVQLINDCFFSGVKVPVIETTTIILDTLCRNMSQGIVDDKEAIVCLSELQNVINRTCLGSRMANDAKLALNKIAALKKTIILMSTLSKEEVIKLETAKMGETGIMYKYTEGEDTYLLKPAVDKQKNELQPFRAEVQEAASKLQRVLNPESAVDVEAVGNKKFKVSKQELIDIDPNKKGYLENWVTNGGPLDGKIADQLMREYVIDMLLCNFDCFAGNFVIDTSGNLRGIDKEQSFRFIDSLESLKADFSYVPNGTARIPIYQYIFQRYNSGELDISFDPIYDTLSSLECISDEDYKAIFKDYAMSLSPDNYEEVLDKIVKRKHDVTTNIRRYIDSLKNKKSAEEFRL